ncbi:hypothetical protein Zmor_024184 [Zophobas morio]|uniref:lysozyme n=1 Tax=Zophobas morio TaxID=2755281 RepID=A0AA38HY61_9CUCU|nr:hypothetical protein Zmor_024184 [Zophobas morio]
MATLGDVLITVFVFLLHRYCSSVQQNLPVNQQCLGCICAGEGCGSFGITWTYWADFAKRTVKNESVQSYTAYANVRVTFSVHLCFGFIEGQNLVPSKCLFCICEAATGCNFNFNYCTFNSKVCGPFRITKPYWEGAGSPTFLEESSNSTSAFTRCASNLHCSIKTVQMFMTKNKRDCNGDGIINCDDFAAIHQLGKYDCHEDLPQDFASSYQECKRILLKDEAANQKES